MRRCGYGLLALALLTGCGQAPPEPTDTGSREVVRDFFEGLLQKDWQRAHAALHPDSRAKYPSERFAQLAQTYRQQLGFEPQEVKVRGCEEHGAEAIAHVTFYGTAGDKNRHFKDSVQLRRGGSAWGVVLPARFGRPR
jgi:hypothetical protein